MSKYVYDNYIITVDFISELSFSIVAQDATTGEVFLNQEAQITKIKKETVNAALARKNQQNLVCKFNLVDVQPRKLVIAFEVNYDFLPSVSEYISLEQIKQKSKKQNKVESVGLRSDIQQLESLIENLSIGNSTIVAGSTGAYSAKTELFGRELDKGSYLLETNGYFVGDQGKNSKHTLIFTIETQNQKYPLEITLHTQTPAGYCYPYSTCQGFDLPNSGPVKVSVECNSANKFSILDNVLSISPMSRMSQRLE